MSNLMKTERMEENANKKSFSTRTTTRRLREVKIWFLGNLQQQLTRRGMCLEVFADRREHRADRLQDQLEGAPLLGRELARAEALGNLKLESAGPLALVKEVREHRKLVVIIPVMSVKRNDLAWALVLPVLCQVCSRYTSR